MNDHAANLTAQSAFSDAWTIRPQAFARFMQTVHAARVESPSDLRQPTPPAYEVINGVAVLPMSGVLMKSPGWLVDFGAMDTDAFAVLVRKATADASVSAILLDVDSPGGEVLGVPEAADAVAAARAAKPVIAYTCGMMASGAYWICSQASAIYTTKLAIVGSIGCYHAVYDYSAMYATAGIKVDLIKSGAFKGVGVAGAPISEAAKVEMQAKVDKVGMEFRAAVSSARPQVKPEVMDGRDFFGADAVVIGLVDSVTGFDRALADAGALAQMR